MVLELYDCQMQVVAVRMITYARAHVFGGAMLTP